MKKQVKIKNTPKKLNPKIEKEYITVVKDIKGKIQEKYLKVRLDSSLTPTHDMLIKLYFYPYLEYIYKVGRGVVYLKHLENYMEKIYQEKPRKVRDIIYEMEEYGLIRKSLKWNNSIIILTNSSMRFFGKVKKVERENDIGFLTSTAFVCEHFNQFFPDRRENFIETVKSENYLISNTKLEELKRSSIYIEKISKNAKREILVTFGILDINNSLDPAMVIEKIELINSYMNPTKTNISFRANICTYSYEKYEYLLKRFINEGGERYLNENLKNEYFLTLQQSNKQIKIVENKEKKGAKLMNIDAYKLKDILFTNLNIEQYFLHSSAKRQKKDYSITK